MNRKSILTFLGSLVVFYALLHVSSLMYLQQKEKLDLKKKARIQRDIQERFRIYLDAPLSFGLLAADYFSTGDLKTQAYGTHIQEILKINPEIIGLNLVDPDGKIIRVYPKEMNPHAEGKISQNFQMFKREYDKSSSFWLSPPFKLYQGEMGYVIYIPVEANGKLKGWVAPVISADRFFEKFRISQLLQDFELIITDEDTGLNYISTALLPDHNPDLFESKLDLRGRTISFKLWPKLPQGPYIIPWHILFAGAFILSLLTIYIQRLYDLRQKAKAQLEDIALLLRLTAKDALSRLIDEDISLEVKNSYISNLLEQIDLLQTMARSGEEPDQEEQYLLPLVEEQIDNISELLHRKELQLEFEDKPDSQAKVFTNRWLFQNCVLNNVLIHSIICAHPKSKISVHYMGTDSQHLLSFHTSSLAEQKNETAFLPDRRLDVAKKVLRLYEGDFLLQRDLARGMVIKVTIPIA